MQKGFLQKASSGAAADSAAKKTADSPSSEEATKDIRENLSKMDIGDEGKAKPGSAATTGKEDASSGSGSTEKPKMGQPTMNIGNQARLFKLGAPRKNPVACIILGMAGSGKTTLMQRINVYIHQNQLASYIINLDPAVRSVPYGCNIDIRDTVNYKEVMKQYQLGPNGGIMTALNLFSTKFDQVMSLLEQRADELKHIFVDTPGQIEIFTWSASGSIISDMLAYSFPTVAVYVVDTPRNASPVTFMSNMLYACSIMYKLRLPFVLVFNKTDIASADFAMEWMTDYEKFRDAVSKEKAYSGTLSSSMCLALEEFYRNLRPVCMSAVTGEGTDRLFEAIAQAAQEYADVYRPALEAKAREKEARERRAVARRLDRTRKRMAAAGPIDHPGAAAGRRKDEDVDEEDDEGEEEDGEEGEGGVFDPDSDSEDEDQDDIEYMRTFREGGSAGTDLFQAACARQRKDMEQDGAGDLKALGELLEDMNEGQMRIDE